MLSVAFFYCYAKCRYAECRYAECRYAVSWRWQNKLQSVLIKFYQIFTSKARPYVSEIPPTATLYR